ncbi:MAG: prolipoprotein diacylglyceryl transferase [Clostridia bacterium]
MEIPYSRTIFGSLPWYSALIVLGILLAICLATHEEKRLGLPKDTVIDLSLIAVPCGIVGARLYYVAMTWSEFAQNPISILYIWEGGIAIYGAIIGGAIGVFFYAKRKKLVFFQLLDILAPGLLLAQAIGRWGNYFNMEAYGPEIKNSLFWFFPAGVLIPTGNQSVWHMATFFYESVWSFTGAAALWALRKRQTEHGSLFCWYMLIYGSGRFIIEQLREDSLYLGGLRVSQSLSLVLCIFAAIVLLWRASKKHKDSLGWFTLSATLSVLLIARWAFLSTPLLYGTIMVLCIAGYAWLCMRSFGSAGTRWLLLPALLDLLGLVLSALGIPFSASFAVRLHTLLCSITLPLYIGVLCIQNSKKSR